MFVPPEGADLPRLKGALYSAGVECSVFYGRHGFFVPVHQALSENDLRYIAEAVSAALSGDLRAPE
jgi:hypothetical protein